MGVKKSTVQMKKCSYYLLLFLLIQIYSPSLLPVSSPLSLHRSPDVQSSPTHWCVCLLLSLISSCPGVCYYEERLGSTWEVWPGWRKWAPGAEHVKELPDPWSLACSLTVDCDMPTSAMHSCCQALTSTPCPLCQGLKTSFDLLLSTLLLYQYE